MVTRIVDGFGAPFAPAGPRAFPAPEAIAAVDSWARDLVRRYFRQGAPVTDRQVHEYFAHYGRWQALVFRCWDWKPVEPL